MILEWIPFKPVVTMLIVGALLYLLIEWLDSREGR